MEVLCAASDPAPRARLGENQPEKRRSLILERLRQSRERAVRITPVPSDGGAALNACALHGVLSAELLDLLRSAHAAWRAEDERDESFASRDTLCATGLVPYWFVRERPPAAAPWERRLAWHASDALTPIFDDTARVLAEDAAVCARAVELVAAPAASSCAVYALTTHPGHHAAGAHYGGYCFVCWAAFVARKLAALGHVPFVVDVDYHAGDGTAALAADPARGFAFVSLHAPADYPYLPHEEGAPAWAVAVPPRATWREYAPLLEAAFARRPPATTAIVLSLGYDGLAADPDAIPKSRMGLVPADFGALRDALRAACGGLPLVAVQEGGYCMEEIPDAAEAFVLG